MSIFDEYRKYKQQIENLEKDLERLRDSPEVKKELARREDVVKRHNEQLALLKLEVDRLANTPEFKRQKRLREIQDEGGKTAVQKPKKNRRVMVFKNPHSGEVVKTKGANHKKLRAWRDKYGVSEVRKWRVDEYGIEQAKKLDAEPKALISEINSDPDVIRAIYLKRIEESGGNIGHGRKKPLYVYKNPQTKEVVVARSKRDKTLNKWRSENGKDTVDSWLVGITY